jgi:hypothetical protein
MGRVAHAGEWKERREALGRAKGERAGRLLDSFPFPFLSSFLFFSKTIQTNYVNSNKFEFKLNTNKAMHQHECTSKLTL